MTDDVSFHLVAAVIFAGLVFLYLRNFRKYQYVLRMVKWATSGASEKKVYVGWPLVLLRQSCEALKIPLRIVGGRRIAWEQGEPRRIDTQTWGQLFLYESLTGVEIRILNNSRNLEVVLHFGRPPKQSEDLLEKLNRVFGERIHAKISSGIADGKNVF